MRKSFFILLASVILTSSFLIILLQPIFHSPTSNSNVSTLPQPVDATNWKTYENTTKGYQIKYPETFQFIPCDKGDCYGDYLKSYDYLGMAKNKGDFTIIINYSDKLNPNQTFDVWYKSKISKDFRSTLILKQKKYSINNYLVNMFNYQPIDPGSNIDDYYYITNENLIFQLRVYGILTTSTQLQIDQILSTFKFTN